MSKVLMADNGEMVEVPNDCAECAALKNANEMLKSECAEWKHRWTLQVGVITELEESDAALRGELDDAITDVENRGTTLRRCLDTLARMPEDILGRDCRLGYPYRDELMDEIIGRLSIEELEARDD